MTAFADLSPEGKRQKLAQHLDTGHPVPAPWVEWLWAENVTLRSILNAIEYRTATGEGLTPEECISIHLMANVRDD